MPKVADIIGNPQVHFQDPVDVALEPALTKDEKLAALSTMEKDAAALEASADDGMPVPETAPLREAVEAAAKVVDGRRSGPREPDADNIDGEREVKLAGKP